MCMIYGTHMTVKDACYIGLTCYVTSSHYYIVLILSKNVYLLCSKYLSFRVYMFTFKLFYQINGKTKLNLKKITCARNNKIKTSSINV